MQHLSTFLYLVAAAINFAPLVGAVSPQRMAAFYGFAIDGPDLEIVLRHRAVLFGIVGVLMVAAALHPPLRTIGYAAGFTSMISFLVLVWLVGRPNEQLRRVVVADLVGIAALAGAGILEYAFPASSRP